MACSRGVKTVDALRVYVDSSMETEGDVRSPDIVVDGLWKTDDVAAGTGEQGRGLVRAGSSQRDDKVKLCLLVVLHHLLKTGASVLLLLRHFLEGLARCSEDGAAYVQDTGEIRLLQVLELSVDESAVTVRYTDDLRIRDLVVNIFCETSDDCVETRTVSACR